jgi:PAS domain S-box-containing protein
MEHHASTADERLLSRAKAGRRTTLFAVAFGTILIVAVLALLAVELWREYRDSLAAAYRETRNLARTIEEQTLRTIQAVDLTLVSVNDGLRLVPPNAPNRDVEIHNLLADKLQYVPFVRAMWIVDAQGTVIYETAGFPAQPTRVEDREYFRAHRDNPNIDIRIGQPFRSRVTGTWSIPVTRTVFGVGGTFAGVLVAAIEPQYFRHFFADINIGRGGSIVWFLRDGTLLTRAPDDRGMIGRSLAGRPLFREHLPRAEAGSYRDTSPVDGVHRILSYRAVSRLPLVIMVGLDASEVLEDWRESFLILGTGSFLFVAAGLHLLVLLVRQLRRREWLLDSLAAKEQSLRESEEQFRGLAEGSIQGIMIATPERKPLFANQALADIFGFASPAEVLTLPSTIELIAPHDRKRAEASRDARLKGEPVPDVFELDCVRRDGAPIRVLVTRRVLRWKGQVAVQSTLIDITDKKKIEEERNALVARYRTILEHMPFGCIVTDHEFRFTYWNPEAERIFGYAFADIAGKHPLDTIVAPDLRDAFQASFQRLKEGEFSEARIDEFVHKDGRRILLDCKRTPLFAVDGRFEGVIAMFHDVTERKALEDQLRQAQKLEAVGQLTGGVAHDFNNLLQVILGNAEMLADDFPDGSPFRPPLAVIKAAAERGAELTNRMLAFSRQQPLQPREFDLATLAADLVPLLRRTLGEAIDIRLHVKGDPPMVVADPSQVENALVNLALNARDAMPDGGTLTIETDTVILDADYVAMNPEVNPGFYGLLAVTDSGAGMPPEVAKRAFEPFFTTKPVGKGSGLGLSMVYGFAKQSGGEVKIYSEVGVGTTVRIYLPAAGTARLPVRPPSAGEGGLPRGNETVLVVEDDPMVRAYATAQIRGLGYTVIDAPDGVTALARLAERPQIELLFTDVILTGSLNGRQLADKATAINPRLKVLYTSGYSEDAIMHQGRLDPGVQLLSKPYRKVDLARKLRRVLDSA